MARFRVSRMVALVALKSIFEMVAFVAAIAALCVVVGNVAESCAYRASATPAPTRIPVAEPEEGVRIYVYSGAELGVEAQRCLVTVTNVMGGKTGQTECP